MCNRYISPTDYEIESFWHIGRHNNEKSWITSIFPRAPGPFIRRARDATGYERELVVGQWALIPWFAKTAKLTLQTARANDSASASTLQASNSSDCERNPSNACVSAASSTPG